ncbi:ATP-binding protein [Campylobacter sp. MIT 99-7217]|uniref:dynamin family protein n=1 Tax=Campylobacter sp. MIT 99-7217 TaxID=535091 RepID=UPI00115ADE5B|nr:dynamin family protein [Campylobacter sp. MIT 99-7217]TQR32404.1 ATP-binding protein [Campylobacter sp. MIT 99-7217]
MKELLEQLWQNHLQFLDFEANFKDKNALDEASAAIILSANNENYERYFLLKEFNEIFKKIDLRVDIFNLQNAQICTLNLLKKGFLDKEDLLKALKILEKISNNSLIIKFIQELNIDKKSAKAVFKSDLKELESINLSLLELCFDEFAKKRLEEILKKFKSLQFNVAITGVMNAGKSSLLNALLKEDFLGVSNIPETANLTILKGGDSNEVKIYFWDKKEWDNILKNAEFNEDLKAFLAGLEKRLDLSEFVKDEGLIKESSLAQLKHFSSAKNELSALIKKIEIQSKLSFLKENICIVDTPGLDDVVVQREILTQEYLKESDFLIHLMNASQSLTQKDSEFLISCLLNSRLSKFLIVLTKADLLSQKELDEVVSYTKESLKKRLLSLEGVNENLVEKIDFLCVSAKRASDFYKGLASKQDFEKSGLKELEEYLFKELFRGEKSKIMLASYKKELLLELKNSLNAYELQNKLILESTQGLHEQSQGLFLELKAQKEALLKAKDEIKASILKLENTKFGVENLLLLLAKKLKQRLLDELKYLKEKSLKPNLTRILNIVDISVKDGISDILREIKFENLKKIDDLKMNLSLKYDFLKDDFENGFEEFKTKLSKSIEDIFSDEKFMLLRMQISQIIQEKNEIYILEKNLDECINEGFKSFELEKLLKDLNINASFFYFLEQRLKIHENLQNEKLASLEKTLQNLNDKSLNSNLSLEANLEKIAKLNELSKELLNAN